MKRKQPPIPTEAELNLLRILWLRGPGTVRELLDALPKERTVGYTTVLKVLQIMLDKGLVERDDSARSHVYAAAVQEERTEDLLVGDFIRRGFSGSAAQLVVRALSTQRASAEELKEIRGLLDELEMEGG